MSNLEVAISLLSLNPISYDDLITGLISNGVTDLAGTVKALRRSPLVKFKVGRNEQGVAYHTVQLVEGGE